MVRIFTSNVGLTIKVGENATENQQLCRQARQKDLWFHLENSPSPHAILEVGNGSDSDVKASLRDGALLVKHFSKKRDLPRATVIYINAKFVSKDGAEDKMGSVSLKKAPNKINVSDDEALLNQLLQNKK